MKNCLKNKNFALSNKKVFLCLMGVLVFCLLAPSSQAKDIEFNLSLSDAITAPGRQVTVFLTFYGRTQMPMPNMPVIEGLDFNYIGSSSKKVEHLGSTVDAVIHAYNVIATKPGHYWIGPFTFSYEGNTFFSNDVLLRAEAGSISRAVEKTVSVAEYEELDITKRVFIELDMDRTEFYVNEAVPITVKFFSDWLDVEDVQVWDAPNDSFVTNKYETGSSQIIERNGSRFVLVEFNKTIFAPEKGTFEFGPVLSSCQVAKKKAALLNNNEAFYNTYIGKSPNKKLELKIDPIEISVLPLPMSGRPSDFRGTIGDFSLDAKIDNNEVTLGSPVTLTITVTGEGNRSSVTAPIMKETDDITMYDPQAKLLDDGITFTQVLKISSPSIKEIPSVSLSYFDPVKKEYITLKSGPFPINMTVPEGFEQPGSIKKKISESVNKEKKERGDKGLIGIKTRIGRIYYNPPLIFRNRGFVLLQFLPLIALAVSILIQKRIHRLKTDRAYAGWLKASKAAKHDLEKLKKLLSKGEAEIYYSGVFKALQNYIGTRLDIDPGGISIDTVEKKLSPRLGNMAVADKLKKLFNDCYDIRYTPSKKMDIDPKETFETLEEVVDYLNNKEKI